MNTDYVKHESTDCVLEKYLWLVFGKNMDSHVSLQLMKDKNLLFLFDIIFIPWSVTTFMDNEPCLGPTNSFIMHILFSTWVFILIIDNYLLNMAI